MAAYNELARGVCGSCTDMWRRYVLECGKSAGCFGMGVPWRK